MPELPDIAAYLHALAPRVVGKRLLQVRIQGPSLLRTADPPIYKTEGKTVLALRRVGKRIVFVLGDDLFLVLHLMIAGRLHWKPAGAKLGGRINLAAFDFEDGTLLLTEAGTKRRASLHLVRGEAALIEMDPGGIDVMNATPEQFRTALSVENRTLKRALTDPRIVSGIGNAYSDEILWTARLSPILQTGKLSDDEWQRLYEATRTALQQWIDRLQAEAEEKFPEKVTAFRPEMAVHGRFGKPCPRCGSPVQRIRYADNETNYCATCQTEGRVLADRSLSRLLGKDWPRTLDELDALKRR
ncbi:Fpg/Nei family DNA glycosylase [Terriglobus albidus]|uniref:Fpg/Nei family DNA glycosylase n=1 Tax=Terriglobus albidus TaxID=1592106 RepID=UPI0021E0B130|nr:DNA-formamidopyrimidine glycosylase family protein [Terriglobus albidus]